MPTSHSSFPATSRTMIEKVQCADPRRQEPAMERFCHVYLAPLHAFARRLGFTVEDAQDLTQEFFLHVIEKQALLKFELQRDKRFHSWLTRTFQNFTSNRRRGQAADKRGGKDTHVDVGTLEAEECYQFLRHHDLEPAQIFDLSLAQQIWRQTRQKLHERHDPTEHGAMVRALEPYLLLPGWPPPPAPPQREFALQYGTTPAQLKAFFNRTLRSHAETYFAAEAMASTPGITEGEIVELWELLRQHPAG